MRLIIFNWHYYVRQHFITIDSRAPFKVHGKKESLNIHNVAYLGGNLMNAHAAAENEQFHHV